MKLFKSIILVVTLTFSFYSCETSPNKNTATTQTEPNLKNLEVAISGMTCEIGCAKTIESKVSKMKGVRFSKVSYNDSIGRFTYDANFINSKTIIAKIDGIADGNTYKVVNSQKVATFVTE